MSEELQKKILDHVKSAGYRPLRERGLARELELHAEEHYHDFRGALRELISGGYVVHGARGAVMIPEEKKAKSTSGLITGSYRHNKRGFGFVIPTDPAGHPDLFIPEGQNGGAITADIVRAKIASREMR